ncbi:hypothetical protein D3C78_1880150 [compost metagenome]
MKTKKYENTVTWMWLLYRTKGKMKMTTNAKNDIITPTIQEIKKDQLVTALIIIIKKYAESKQ